MNVSLLWDRSEEYRAGSEFIRRAQREREVGITDYQETVCVPPPDTHVHVHVHSATCLGYPRKEGFFPGISVHILD